MAETKKVFKFFTIQNRKEEEAFLRQEHKAGWQLIKIDNLHRYFFEKCDGMDFTYHMECEPAGGIEKDDLKRMEVYGWEKVLSWKGFSYFRKKTSKIKTDEDTFCNKKETAMRICRLYKKKAKWILLLFVILAALSLYLTGNSGMLNLIRILQCATVVSLIVLLQMIFKIVKLNQTI